MTFNSYAQFTLEELIDNYARCMRHVREWFPRRHTRYEVRLWVIEAARVRAALRRKTALRQV